MNRIASVDLSDYISLHQLCTITRYMENSVLSASECRQSMCMLWLSAGPLQDSSSMETAVSSCLMDWSNESDYSSR